VSLKVNVDHSFGTFGTFDSVQPGSSHWFRLHHHINRSNTGRTITLWLSVCMSVCYVRLGRLIIFITTIRITYTALHKRRSGRRGYARFFVSIEIL